MNLDSSASSSEPQLDQVFGWKFVKKEERGREVGRGERERKRESGKRGKGKGERGRERGKERREEGKEGS